MTFDWAVTQERRQAGSLNSFQTTPQSETMKLQQESSALLLCEESLLTSTSLQLVLLLDQP